MRQVSYGLNPLADVYAENISIVPDGLRFNIKGLQGSRSGERLPVSTSLVGAFNVYNCLAAAVAVSVLNIPDEIIKQGIKSFAGVPGRMEKIDFNIDFPGVQSFLAFVDFAHTPNALQRVLESARSMSTGKVIVIFGSAGLRDQAKRKMMAEIASELADFSIITAEDPRTESLDNILKEMAFGAESRGGKEGQTFWRIPDRRSAIRFAVRLAKPGDLIIACGKGHEQSMCFGEIEYAWDDRAALRAALGERFGISGYEMPYLPME